MRSLRLKPAPKLVEAYYAALAQFDQHGGTRETAVRQPFLNLLRDRSHLPRNAAILGWS